MALDPRNPFAAPSDLPFAVPPFDRIRVEHYAPAFEAGMAEHLREVDELLAADLTPAEFLDALQSAGQLLGRAEAVFFNLVGTDADDALRAVQEEFSPRLSAHHDAVRLDPRLVERVRALHEDPAVELDPEQRRLLEELHRDAVRSGALLDEADAARLRELNDELSRLTTRFDVELLADTNALAVHVRRRRRARGPGGRGTRPGRGRGGRARRVPPPARAAHRSAGAGVPAAQGDPPLVHEASVARGGRGGAHDTRRAAAAHRGGARRAGRAARLPRPRLLGGRRRDRRRRRGRRRHAAPPRSRRRRQRPPRGGRTHRAAPRRRRGGAAAAVGLGPLRRAVAPAAVRRGRRGAAALVRARTRPGRRGLRDRHRALRADLHRTHRRAGVLARRPRLRGRRRRPAPSACTCSTPTRGSPSGAGRG